MRHESKTELPPLERVARSRSEQAGQISPERCGCTPCAQADRRTFVVIDDDVEKSPPRAGRARVTALSVDVESDSLYRLGGFWVREIRTITGSNMKTKDYRVQNPFDVAHFRTKTLASVIEP